MNLVDSYSHRFILSMYLNSPLIYYRSTLIVKILRISSDVQRENVHYYIYYILVWE